MKRRAVLEATSAIVVPGVAGCLSESNDATATATPNIAAQERTTQHTHSSPTPAPAHPVDLLLENHSERPHDLSVRITDTGETVYLDAQYTLESREERTVHDVLSAPTGGVVTYVVSARLEGGPAVSERITAQIPADLHLLGVFVTGDDEVTIDHATH